MVVVVLVVVVVVVVAVIVIIDLPQRISGLKGTPVSVLQWCVSMVSCGGLPAGFLLHTSKGLVSHTKVVAFGNQRPSVKIIMFVEEFAFPPR